MPENVEPPDDGSDGAETATLHLTLAEIADDPYNYASDPNFERNDGSWPVANAPGAEGDQLDSVWTIEANHAYVGNKSLRCANRAGGWSRLPNSNVFECSEGDRYHVRVFVETVHDTAFNLGQAGVILEFYDADDELINDPIATSLAGPQVAYAETPTDVVHSAPSGTAKIRITMYTYDQTEGYWHFDQVRVTRAWSREQMASDILRAIAAVSDLVEEDSMVYFTAAVEAAITALSPFARTLLDDPDEAAMRATLGLGNSATKNVGTTAGTVAAGDDSRFGGGTPANDSVTNAILANMAAKTYKGRTTNSVGDPEDVPAATLKADLGLVKGDVGLGNVDNTSDLNKPISTAQQTALNAKQPLDQDLTDIAALAPVNDDVIQRKSGAWTNRTVAQLKADLALGAADNVTHGSLALSGSVSPILDVVTSGAGVPFQMQNTSNTSFSGFNFKDDAGTLVASFVASNSGASVHPGNVWCGTRNASDFIFVTNGTTERMRITSTGDVSIGAPAAVAAKLHVRQATLGSEVQRLESTATNDDPVEMVYQNRAATTTATVTTLHTFTVPASTTYAIEAIIVARRTGGSAGTAEDGAFYKIAAVFKNVSGAATIIGAVQQLVAQESQAGWDATFDVTGATVRCRVTGALNNNITWHMTARVWQVST
ncbi:MAG TPA: hypothetical protein VF708_20030 [Pyrinomonadaceae bacterium]|jgi:hypothetical protein